MTRAEIEKRYTGFALLPQIVTPADAPQLQVPRFDQYITFGGISQKVDYHFPLTNTGKMRLSVEIASTSCGCTAAVLAGTDSKKLSLAPRANSEVVVSYQVQSQAAVQQMVTLQNQRPAPSRYLSFDSRATAAATKDQKNLSKLSGQKVRSSKKCRRICRFFLLTLGKKKKRANASNGR